MSADHPWATLYVYSQEHTQQLNDLIEAINTQKGEICSFEDFKQFDVLHLGGHSGLISLLSEVNITNNDAILDVGCGLGGSGRFLHQRTGASVHGIDILSNLLQLCNKMTLYSGKSDKLTYEQADINTMEFPENRFDGAYSIGVYLVYISGNAGMKSIFKALKPGGWFYLEDWYALMPYNQMPQDIQDILINDLCFNLHTEEQIREELQDAGFVIEYLQDNGNSKSEHCWARSQQILKQYKDQGETGDPLFMKQVTDYGLNLPKICPHLDHLSPEQIRERYPQCCEYIFDWENIIYSPIKYTSHVRVLAKKPLT